MSLESFYGGKQGISPVIKGSFKYVDTNDPAYIKARDAGASPEDLAPDTMDIRLADSNYEDVWYNELCIIDTTNRANPNNGNLYRRTLKGRGDTGNNLCAEYIGRIVGTPGTNPFMIFTDLNGVKTAVSKEDDSASDTVVYWPYFDKDTEKVTPTSKSITDPDDLYVFNGDMDGMLVPGKIDKDSFEKDNFNDTIKYTWFNIIDEKSEEPTPSKVYLGFQIPYPSLEVFTTAVDWDEEVSIEKRSGTHTLPDEREFNYNEHPFYHVWDIDIPRGVRGNAASNIRLAYYNDFNYNSTDTTSEKPFLYDFKLAVTEVNTQRGTFDIEKKAPAALTTDLTNEEKQRYREENVPFWVYDYTFYDKAANKPASIQPYTFYLGSYQEIKDIKFDDDGTVTVIYSSATEKEFPQKIRWIKNIEIDNNGKITFAYNHNYIHTLDSQPQAEKQYYTYSDNQYNKTNKPLIQFDEGVDYYEFIDNYTKQLPYPDKLDISDEGIITISFLDGTYKNLQEYDKKALTKKDFLFNYVKTWSVDPNTKVLSYTTYPNNETTTVNDDKGLNYLQAMTVDDRFHLLGYHASSQYRPAPDATPKSTTKDGQNFVNNVNYPDIDKKEFWQDFGIMRDVSRGLRILHEFKLSDYPGYPESLNDVLRSPNGFIDKVLKPQYWDSPNDQISNPYFNGNIPGKDWTETSLRGSVCYTSLIDDGSAYFYDYDAESWKYVGSWNQTTVESDINIKLKDGSQPWETPLPQLTLTGIELLEKKSQKKSNGSLINPWRARGLAYAVLNSEGTLTFFRSENEYSAGVDKIVTDIDGNEYKGEVFVGIENTETSAESIPWYSKRSSIFKVDIVDGQIIKPIRTAYWFDDCNALTEIDLTGLDTSNVTDMRAMFYYCGSLESLNLSNFSTSNVTDMRIMFSGCQSLKTIYANNWYNLSQTVSSDSMFENCTLLPNYNAESIDWTKALIQPDGYFTNLAESG